MKRTGAGRTRSDATSSVPLRRAFGVVELVALAPEGLTASEVADQLDLPLVTAYRMLQRLNDIGILEGRGRNARYVVGTRLMRISQSIAGGGSIVERARPIIQGLANEFGMVAYLAGLFEFEALLLLAEAPTNAEAPFVHPGRQFKIHASAGGKVLLAFQPDWLIDQFLSRPLERFNERTIAEPDAFRSHLAEIKRQGYAVANGESDSALWGVACPVFEGGGNVSYSVGLISFRYEDKPREDFIAQATARLKIGAAEVAALVGRRAGTETMPAGRGKL
jgi:DNA-binding IclR family transcriptional regulator